MTCPFLRSRSPFLWLVAALGAALLASGCNRTGLSGTVPVTGTVTLEGKPVEGATVLFSRGAGKIGAGELALGKTDAQGRYELTTKVGGETEVKGALPGEYKVVVSKRVPPKGMSESEYHAKVEAANKASEAGPAAPGSPQVPELVELFPSRYSVLTGSELKATVKSGSNDIPFDLK